MMDDGTETSDGRETSVQGDGTSLSSQPEGKHASARSKPGILIFSRGEQVLHMNRRALELIGCFDREEARLATVTLSKLVSELRGQIQQTLDSRAEAYIWGAFEMQCVLYGVRRTLLLRGFGLPNRNAIDRSRVIIIFEEGSFRRERRNSQSQTNPRSSDRERAAV